MREPSLGLVCGKKGVGKSYTTFGMLLDYVSGKYAGGGLLLPARRVLILDVNDEYGEVEYNGYKYKVASIDREYVQKFSVHPKIEIRRIRPINPDGRKWGLKEIADTLFFILEYYSGGLLVIEDINRYVSDSLPNDLIGAICTNRHRDLDIIAQFQSVGRVTPKLWQNANWMRFHKNADSIDKHKTKAEDKYKIVKICENMVNDQVIQGNKRFNVFIDLDTERINGNYTVEMLSKAVIKYLIDNKNTIVKTYVEYHETINSDAEKSEGGIILPSKKLSINEMKQKTYAKYFDQLVEETMLECCSERMVK